MNGTSVLAWSPQFEGHKSRSFQDKKQGDVIEKEQQIGEAYYTTIKQQQNDQLILLHRICQSTIPVVYVYQTTAERLIEPFA